MVENGISATVNALAYLGLVKNLPIVLTNQNWSMIAQESHMTISPCTRVGT